MKALFHRIERESAQCKRIEGARAPAALALLVIVAGFYALLPSAFSPPVSVEGFEAAVTNVVNQALFAPSPTPIPTYLYETRPGEYALYRASTAILPGDALFHGQLWSLLAYVAGLSGTVLMARSAGFARPLVAALAYFCLFDVATNVGQASSSNLAMGFVALGGGLFSLRSFGAKAAAVVVFAFAVFCRLDAIVLVPFALLLSLLAAASAKRWFLSAALAGSGVALLAIAFYASSGVSIVQVLGENQGTTGQFSFYGIKNLVLTLFPWSIVPPLLGITIGQDRAWRNARYCALIRTLVVLGPISVMGFLYLGKMETPRFLASASPFLALGTALLIERILSATRRAQLMAATSIIIVAIGSWALRAPGMTNDGFRYRWATFLTPYERFREKRFMRASSDRMISEAVDCVECRDADRFVLATSWRAYPETIRGLILRGATLTAVVNPPADFSALGSGLRFRIGERFVTIYNLDAANPSVRPSDLPAALDVLRSAGAVSVVGNSMPVFELMLRGRQAGSMLWTSAYDRHDLSSNHVARFPAVSRRSAPGNRALPILKR